MLSCPVLLLEVEQPSYMPFVVGFICGVARGQTNSICVRHEISDLHDDAPGLD